MEVTLTMGWLFNWSPKAQSEIMKVLTRQRRDFLEIWCYNEEQEV
ncbi:30179_t:CDS:2 [Gigaspora margarita]|uniref:30179_t:CDS:1 n=1 Tax=Gigaspora margarita TaxID=4874 RepID=A0ABN7UG24_GIGMA|nr:30179_t:CDS:2 [Gigaspora margarita]